LDNKVFVTTDARCNHENPVYQFRKLVFSLTKYRTCSKYSGMKPTSFDIDSLLLKACVGHKQYLGRRVYFWFYCCI